MHVSVKWLLLVTGVLAAGNSEHAPLEYSQSHLSLGICSIQQIFDCLKSGTSLYDPPSFLIAVKYKQSVKKIRTKRIRVNRARILY